MFDENYILKDAGAMRVPDNAGFDPGMEIAVTPQQIAFANPIRPQQKGYIYIWVSNESENTKVWFDDLKVTHRSRRVTQATDYYAYGSVLREQKTPEELTYRYKYQGQYAEKDEETGWSHFELREYDPIVARWTASDPAGQYYSPYVGMGNDPISNSDSDGAYSKWCASIRAFFTKGASEIYRVENQWGFNAPDGTMFEVNGTKVNGYTSYFGDGSGLDINFTAGLQAGIGIRGVATVDVTVVNFELFSSDPEKYYDEITEVTNSIGLTIEPVGKKLLGAEIGQTQNARRVPGGTRVRGYHKFAKGAIFGYEK